MLKIPYLLAKIGADTAENEQHLAEILPIGRLDPELAERRRGAPALRSCSRAAPAGSAAAGCPAEDARPTLQRR